MFLDHITFIDKNETQPSGVQVQVQVVTRQMPNDVFHNIWYFCQKVAFVVSALYFCYKTFIGKMLNPSEKEKLKYLCVL